MCMVCGNSTTVDVMIIDKDSSRIYCPNCLATALGHDMVNLCNNPSLTDDITGEKGAILYITYKEQYCLNRDTMKRLISHTLTSTEWKILHDKYVKPTGAFMFMLHDDFYDENGNYLDW